MVMTEHFTVHLLIHHVEFITGLFQKGIKMAYMKNRGEDYR